MNAFVRDNRFALIILLIAAVLRLINLGNVDFVHDELSALSRTGYIGFGNLIRYAIQIDAHPPLVQVFLNYWVLLTSMAEVSVKLPFILCGLGGIWLVWLIGKSWFGETAALSAMAYLACAEYVIAYHQQARPYAVGSFFCLLAVWGFTRYFTENLAGKRKFLLIYIFAAAAAALSHHLALLFIGLFASLSLLLIRKQQLKTWLLAHLALLLLYLPNLPILLKQLSYKGVGEWLGAPGWHSFRYIFGWFTHYTPYCAFIISIAAIAGFMGGWLKNDIVKKKILLIVLSLGCIFTPFFYSIYVNPIFQFSSLFFVLPFLMLLFFSGLPSQRKASLIIPLMILLSTGGSFLFSRDYYSIAAHQPVAEICRQTIGFLKKHPEKKALVCLNTEPWFVKLYQQKYHFSFPYKAWQGITFRGKDLKSIILKEQPAYLVLGWMPEPAIVLGRQYFPCMMVHEKSPQLDFYVFGRVSQPVCASEKICFESRLFGPKHDQYWENRPERIALTNSAPQLVFNNGDEFGVAFEAPLEAMRINRHSILECSAYFAEEPNDAVNLTAVISREGSGEPEVYVSESSGLQIPAGDTTRQLHLRTRIVDAFRENHQLKNCKLKVYIWNRNKSPLKVSQIEVKWLEGNPKMYGLYEE